MKLSDAFQKYLPFGYLYLIVMGVLKESIYYHQLGINILNYSTLSDILISPVAELTTHWIMLVGIFLTFLFGTIYYQLLKKFNQKEWAQKILGKKKGEPLLSTQEIVSQKLPLFFVKFSAVLLLSFFLGIGVGKGRFTSKRIIEDKMKFKHTITYNSGEKEEVFLLGNNSVYYFYVPKGTKNIRIAPLNSIKSLDMVDNKALR